MQIDSSIRRHRFRNTEHAKRILEFLTPFNEPNMNRWIYKKTGGVLSVPETHLMTSFIKIYLYHEKSVSYVCV